MALAYTNVIIEIREISLRDRPEELYAASKKGTVPVLITTENKVIDESLEIMMWALENSPNQTWLSNDSNEEMGLIKENDTTEKYYYLFKNRTWISDEKLDLETVKTEIEAYHKMKNI